MGLSFSVPEGVKVPSSLVNIFKELKQDLGCSIPSHGNLEKWAVQKKVFLVLLGEIVFMAAVIAGTMLGAHTYTHRSLIVGVLCIIFNIGMYTSPLTIMRKVIKTKSVKYMPFWLSLTNCLNGFVWTTYALLPIDTYMLIPNGFGAISGVVQLALYAYYCRSTPVEQEGDVKAGVQLSSRTSAV